MLILVVGINKDVRCPRSRKRGVRIDRRGRENVTIGRRKKGRHEVYYSYLFWSRTEDADMVTSWPYHSVLLTPPSWVVIVNSQRLIDILFNVFSFFSFPWP